MSTNLENSAVATGLGKVSFHSSSIERQCQRMLKLLLYNCSHFTHQQGNAQNPSSQTSAVHELKNFRCKSGIEKGRETELPTSVGSQKKQGNSRKPPTSASLTMLKPLTVSDFLQPHGLQSTRLFYTWNSQARKLEWVGIPFSRGSSRPCYQTWVSCITGRFFTVWATREVLIKMGILKIKTSQRWN